MRGVIRARVRGGSSLDVNDMKGATRAHRGAARDLRPDAELAIARAAMHRAARAANEESGNLLAFHGALACAASGRGGPSRL